MMVSLWDAIASLFGGGSSSTILPGDMPGDPNYRRPPGYDPDAARWAQISRALLEAGARVASAPRDQAVGQGLQGFIEGSDAGKQNYEDGLLNELKWGELGRRKEQEKANPAYFDPLVGNTAPHAAGISVPADLGYAGGTGPYGMNKTSGGRTRPGGAPTGSTPGIGAALTEDEIDRMPLIQLVQINPAQLTPEQYCAVSRRLFREGH